ncbi:MAG: DUF3987 domain-containing protein [Desulfovibrio sp.]
MNHSTNKELLVKAASVFLEVGLSVIAAHKDKTPCGPWKAFQAEPAIQHALAATIQREADAIALVCGAVSGNLEMIDFDLKGELYAAWTEIVMGEAPGVLERLVIEKSQSGGWHVIYRCPGLTIPGNSKLALRGIEAPDANEVEIVGKKYKPTEIDGHYYVVVTLIETRGEGGYFLCTPSPAYTLTQGRISHMATITPSERAVLIRAARSLNEWVSPKDIRGRVHNSSQAGQEQPGEAYNRRGDIRAILQKHAWAACGHRGDIEQWRRPGKTHGTSASLLGGKVFYVFSTNAAPFDADQGYSSFGVYALLEHGGDFKEAAKALAKEGFGSPPPRNQTVKLQAGKPDDERNSNSVAWTLARELFPRRPFPWSVFPDSIAQSLQQLARACAGSANPLPGAALCIMNAALGRTLAVRPKDGWTEPLIVWNADIRISGDGKTAPAWKLLRLFQQAQAAEHERFKQADEDWRTMDKKDRDGIPPPVPARSYFATDLTLEGLRSDLEGHPTGGTVIMLSELSSFVSSQNQYKKGGSDRESWLCLHDGNDARVVRAGKTMLITGARPQVLGGIQPGIFGAVFGGEGGQYLEDGTIFRFLVTCEPSAHYPLTGEAWNETNRTAWEDTLSLALQWANRQAGTMFPVRLSEEALALFLDWRNGLDIQKTNLPVAFRGFLPKAYGYALRLAGGLHAIRQFAHGLEPCPNIGPEELQHGLDAVGFYLGQAVDALQVILEDEHAPPLEVSARTVRLAQVLAALRGGVESGRLAVGHVWEHFNAGLPSEEQFATSNSFGAFLRTCGLTITPGKHNANGRRGVHCLVWDEQVENYVKTGPPCPPSPLSQAGSSVMAADQGETISAGSAERGDALILEADQADFVSDASAAENPLEFDESGAGGQGGLLMSHYHLESKDGAFA